MLFCLLGGNGDVVKTVCVSFYSADRSAASSRLQISGCSVLLIYPRGSVLTTSRYPGSRYQDVTLFVSSDAPKWSLVLFEMPCGIFLKVFEHLSRRALASHSLCHFFYI